MSWKVLYLSIAIACFVMAIWRLARGGSKLLVLTAITWFFIILTMKFVPTVYSLVLVKGVPPIGKLVHYIVLPIFIILSLNSIKSRH